MQSRITPLHIAVFAHNEENNIKRCLLSILDATKYPEHLNINVLINGSTDETYNITSQLSKIHPQIKIINIDIGDKANAWNEYIYSNIDKSSNHYFMDGDAWLPSYCLDKLEDTFDTDKHWGLATIPIGISESLRTFLLKHGFLSGALYAISGDFISEVLKNDFKMPIGFIGDDSLVMYLLQEGFSTNTDKIKSIQVVEYTSAIIPKLKMSVSTLKLLHTRYKRYAIRHFQQEILYSLGRNNEFKKLPDHSKYFKKYLFKIGLKPFISINGVQTLYHPYAIIKLLLEK